jgi:RNA polymerase sigma-70 factor (ECF subfamily)
MTSASPQLVLDVLPDADLVACAKDGNPDCFASLYERYRKMVRLFLARMLHQNPRLDPEDMEQQTFLKAWQHLHQFQGRGSFQTWLISIAINEVRVQYRKNRRAGRLDSLDETFEGTEESEPRARVVAAPGLDPETRAMLQELQDALMESVGELPETLREVARLGLMGLNVKEIATRLGISISATKSRLHRAHLRLEARFCRRVDCRQFRAGGNMGPAAKTTSQALNEHHKHPSCFNADWN